MTSMPPLFTSMTTAATPTSTDTGGTPQGDIEAGQTGEASGTGLSGGQIAGIVVGSVLGGLLLLALLIGCLLLVRRRRGANEQNGYYNRPPPIMTQTPSTTPASQFESVPGGRVARMTALEGENSTSPENNNDTYGGAYSSSDQERNIGSARKMTGTAPMVAGAIPVGKRKQSPAYHSDEQEESPKSSDPYSSPEGPGSGQSEQLPFFKDYYSSDEIHPGNHVATLWAYQPRAGDEFELERGDMLKVIGIWDDGWATGVRLSERAEDWEGRGNEQRDSGVSDGSQKRPASPPVTGDVKAFPVRPHALVYW